MSNQNRIEKTLPYRGQDHLYYDLRALEERTGKISKMPFSIRILLENALRNYDGFAITDEHIDTLLNWTPVPVEKEIPYMPARVLMQDFTGVPAVVDIASIRAEYARQGGDPEKINPLIPVDLVVDHSVTIEYYGTDYAYDKNVAIEYERNSERYKLLKWAQKAFKNFSVVPPGMGICHQVNLEYLAQAVIARDGKLFPDTLVGTDSHTPMVNGIGVIGWGVGGIEAEAALLGQPLFFLLPEVIGLRLGGRLQAGTTATDMVLTIANLLRKFGVVNKFVEVFGPGLDELSVPDRATIGNMSPEFGCTVSYFPIDDRTLDYMRASNRPAELVDLVERYCKTNLLWRANEDAIVYSHVLELDLGTVQPTVAGPSRPQDKVLLRDIKSSFTSILDKTYQRSYTAAAERAPAKPNGTLRTAEVAAPGGAYPLSDGSVVIAAITSCTNTSNPDVMVGAGLLARKAVERGLGVKPWVKTSLAPGSKVVTDYLERAEVLEALEALRFHVVGYGCTTCIGNSGPLKTPIANAIEAHDLVVASVLSGNRNFEARIHNAVKLNFLMSPMLVVAFALAGRVDIDFDHEPVGYDPNDQPVFLRDIWPATEEIRETVRRVTTAADYAKNYGEIFDGNEQWRALEAPVGQIFQWDENSTYIKEAPFFQNLKPEIAQPQDLRGARALLVLGDSVTTDHISPAGNFKENTPAGRYLKSRGVEPGDFNSYGSRRGHDAVMIRGTFANVRIKNRLASKEGGFTAYLPTGEETTVYEAAEQYKTAGIPTLILGGKEYGSGSSRDWAAKGTFLLGVKAVLVESFERIHRSNLAGMGVLPLQFKAGQNAATLALSGTETFEITGIGAGLRPNRDLRVKAVKQGGETIEFDVVCRLDSDIEIEYYKHGGILQYVLRRFLEQK
jgi:aconitate hydratase